MRLKFMPILYIFIFMFFCCGCQNEEVENRKNLMVAVDKFYTAILNENLSEIYDYFPESFKETRSKDDFLKQIKDYSKTEAMAAFSLLPILKYDIISVQPLVDDRFEVTVVIYVKNPQQQMKDIMIWKLMADGSWKNISYANLVENLLKSVKSKQENAIKSVLDMKKCKNNTQEIILALWEYCSQKNITYAEFNAVPKDKWIDLLKSEHKFLDDKAPSCPSDGVYEIRYDYDQQQLIVGCSKHQTLFIPYKFNTMPSAAISAPDIDSNVKDASKSTPNSGKGLSP